MKRLIRTLVALAAVTIFVGVVVSVGLGSSRTTACAPVDQQYERCGRDHPGNLDKPDYLVNNVGDVILHVDTSACSGFAPAELILSGRWATHYKVWYLASGLVGVEAEGWTDVDVSASVMDHAYRVHQRYLYPRAFQEYVLGWATTVIRRDDGASMRGYARLGADIQHMTEWISWESAPTCSPARH
jgi:hypothetical protein